MKKVPERVVGFTLGLALSAVVTSASEGAVLESSTSVSNSLQGSNLGSSPDPASGILASTPARESGVEDRFSKTGKSELPFWRRSADRLLQIREGRSIQVSSRREDLANGEMNFVFNGAGDISKTCDFTFKMAQQFERLPEISEHFKDVNNDPERGQVFLTAVALGYNGKLLMNTEHAQSYLEHKPILKFEVVWGAFKGLRGELLFDSIESGKCEVSVVAHYLTSNPPIPKALFGFALEVLIQKVAGRMRALAERTSEEDLKSLSQKSTVGRERALELIFEREKIPLNLLRPFKALSSPDKGPSVETPRLVPPKNLQTF